MKLSIVIPVYYNEDNLIPLYNDIKSKVIDKIIRMMGFQQVDNRRAKNGLHR